MSVACPFHVQRGKFLSLPLSLFNFFDAKDSGYVNLYQVFVMLALYCSGATSDKVAFCFRMFDVDYSSALEKVCVYACVVHMLSST